MKNFFFSNICLEKFKGTYSTEINYGLFCFFKNSTYLMNQIAHCFYNNQGTLPSTQSSTSALSGSRS